MPIMELIADNFSRRLHHPETISPLRRTLPLEMDSFSIASVTKSPRLLSMCLCKPATMK